MLYQIPYNFEYSKPMKNYINEKLHLIHSIYFGFTNASRATVLNKKSLEEHVKCLKEFKDKGIKLAYVLNQVIAFNGLDETDKFFLESNLVDIVILSQDKMFDYVYERYGDKFIYETSRFYYYLNNNKGKLLENSQIVAFGFKKELDQYWKEIYRVNPNISISFIANENCYSKCEFKIQHNTNKNLRNNGVEVAKFNCPYLDKRYFYSEEDVNKVCEEYPIEIIKVCDRAFDDATLLEHMRKWVK